jgi:DNA-binding CsgD family transcriptional regulator
MSYRIGPHRPPRGERTLRAEVEPAAGMSLRYARAVLELARGRYQEALAAFGSAEKLAATLVGPHTLVTSMRSRMLHALVRAGQTERAEQALTDSETRVLRYLPTHLTTHEIAAELFVSVNTVGTHRRHLYAKLGVHTRHEAVNRARALGLLAPSAPKD